MIIALDQLIINCEDVVLVKTDYDEKITKTSQFRWLRPSTWSLQPIETKETTYYMQIFYVPAKSTTIKPSDIQSFKWQTSNQQSAMNKVKEVARQLKIQLKVQDQEALDAIFENAIKDA